MASGNNLCNPQPLVLGISGGSNLVTTFLGHPDLIEGAVREREYLPSLLRFSKPKTAQFEDQSDPFPLSF